MISNNIIFFPPTKNKQNKQKTVTKDIKEWRVKYVGACVGCMSNTHEAQISSAGWRKGRKEGGGKKTARGQRSRGLVLLLDSEWGTSVLAGIQSYERGWILLGEWPGHQCHCPSWPHFIWEVPGAPKQKLLHGVDLYFPLTTFLWCM